MHQQGPEAMMIIIIVMMKRRRWRREAEAVKVGEGLRVRDRYRRAGRQIHT